MTVPSLGLAPDPAVPARDLLLDPARFATHAAGLLGCSADLVTEHARLRRATYQVGRGLRVVYRIAVGDATVSIGARSFAPGRGLRRYRPRTDAAPLPTVVIDGELRTVFWTLPYDRKLDHLATLMTSRAPGADLDLPSWTSSHLVAYAPEKSATLACLDESGHTFAYARLYADARGEEACAAYLTLHERAQRTHGDGLIPRPLVHAPDRRVFVVAALEGAALADVHGSLHAYPERDSTVGDVNPVTAPAWSNLRCDLRRFGAALAALHNVGPPPERRFTRFDDRRLQSAASTLATARPDVAAVARHIAECLAATRPTGEAEATLHGDVHPKNAIVSADRVALIDFEESARGPAAADLGSLFAGFAYLRTVGALTAAMERRIVEAVATGYASGRPLPPASALLWYTAAALFVERASRSVTRIREAGLARLADVLRVAQSLVVELEGRP